MTIKLLEELKMHFNGFELLEIYAQKEYKKTGKALDYYFFIESNITKEEFLQDYFNFLKTNKYCPLDILNSKIETLDIVYVPLTLYTMYSHTKIEGEIGKYRTVKEFGGLEYNPNTHRQEVFYNNKLVTDWYNDEFFVDSKASGIFCENKYFAEMLSLKYPTQKELFNFFNSYSYVDTAPKTCNRLENNVDYILSEAVKLNDIIMSDTDKKIDKELKSRGDTYRNIKQSLPPDKEGNYITLVPILMPVGFIRYTYNSNNYLYIKILDGKNGTVLKAECPREELSSDMNGSPSSDTFLLYLGFWIVLFGGYYAVTHSFSNLIINEKALSLCIKIIIGSVVLQVIDWVRIAIAQGSKEYEYVKKRQKYLYELFDKHARRLKKLVLQTDKSYKEI